MTCSVQPSAAQSAVPHDFAIQPQPLTEAIMQFGRQSGLQVTADTALVQGKTGAAVSGRLAPAEALSRLLTDTGLTFRFTSATTAILEPAPQAGSGVVALGPVRVEGNTGASVDGTASASSGSPSDPFAGAITPPTSVASKLPVSQRETPQTVNVISRQQIQQQNLVNLNDALRQTPGVIVAPYRDARADLFARGFPIDNIQIEGVPFDISTASNGPLSPDLAMYDRVEVLKGPAGLFNGFAGPGGTVNLIRKHPFDHFAMTGDLGIGSYNDYREALDVTGPLNANGSIRARLVESYERTDLTQDTTYRRPFLVYGVVEANLTPTTLLRVGASYQDFQQRSVSQGLPAYSDYHLIDDDRSRYFGNPDNHDSYRSTTVFVDLEQKLGSDWKLKLSNAYFGNRSFDLVTAYPNGAVDPVTGDFAYFGFSGRERIDQFGSDANIAGPLHLLGRTHQLVLGFDYQHTDDYLLNGLSDGSSIANLGQDVGNLPALPIGTYYGGTTLGSRHSLYANGRFSLLDPLTLILGGNIMWWHAIYEPDAQNNPFGSTRTDDRENGKLTPYAALVLDLDRHHSIYGSFAKIFQPQTARTSSGDLVKPVSGDQYEIGVKGEYLDGALNAALALFQITESNRAITDPNAPLFSGFSIPEGKVRNRGIELSLAGRITQDWSINAGYTYTNVKILTAADTGNTVNVDGWEPFTAIAPKHLFKLWTDYRLPGQLSKWSVGASLYVTSQYGTVSDEGNLTQKGYATVDARLAYRVTPKITVALNATNIGDKHYYQSVGSLASQNFWGEPRRVLATVHMTY